MFCIITVCIIFLINILFSNLYFLLGDCFFYFLLMFEIEYLDYYLSNKPNIFLTAREVGVNLKDGYNGDISAKDAGKIGGQMVKKMIEQAERNMK